MGVIVYILKRKYTNQQQFSKTYIDKAPTKHYLTIQHFNFLIKFFILKHLKKENKL